MYYFNLYQKKLIPQMGLKDLYEQKDLFEKPCVEGPEIRKAICERIEVLEVEETIKSMV